MKLKFLFGLILCTLVAFHFLFVDIVVPELQPQVQVFPEVQPQVQVFPEVHGYNCSYDDSFWKKKARVPRRPIVPMKLWNSTQVLSIA